MNQHVYNFNQIVVVGNLAAMAYAFKYECPIIYKYPNPPHKFDTLSNGFSKLDAYEGCCLLLSLCGLIPIGDKAESIRIDNNILKISTTDARLVKVQYNKLLIFEEEQIDNLPAPQEAQHKEYEVIDWFDVRSGMRHAHSMLESDSDFVRYIYFYLSDRINGNHDKKDLVAFSHIAENDINTFECSPTYVRFKVEKMLKDAGIRGQRNGRNPLYPERSAQPYKYRALIIEHAYRETRCVSRPKIKNTKNLKFMYLSAEDIFNSKSKNTNAYLKKLKDKWNQELKIHGLST